MSDPLIGIIILNTNRKDDTLACLSSLQNCRYPNLVTWVLDNSSSDGSVEAICDQYPQTRIIRLTENKGYAGNNNAGIHAALQAGADWVFVLNEDTILDPLSISHLIQFGISNQQAGILGPLVYHFDEPEIIQSAGGKITKSWQAIHIGQNEQDQGQFIQPIQVDWISGCAILIRREVIEQVGGIDERYFYYWEETEWCIRARSAGWQVWMVPQAKIWHKGVQRNYQPSPNVTYYATRNRLLTLSKHRASFSDRVGVNIALFRTLLAWSFLPRWKNKKPHRNALLQGMIDFYSNHFGARRKIKILD
ncbi:predicted glycosyltransferases [Bellilinea caldifistulae]|uniref:glycosyltransferase family 2 protein n=1 Tax=Bellilinea caldifistulae TaxID=360411 RepID=UPI0007860CC8|nr:glycosyltransferase family 2 protein [Bellilinea caldifistulae]GAP10785.1 predicted glycosyltransferases [Bellilinea caldifistulae]